MHGSPTILVDGTDPFAQPGQLASVSCRLYRDSDGHVDGAPSVSQLRQAIQDCMGVASCHVTASSRTSARHRRPDGLRVAGAAAGVPRTGVRECSVRWGRSLGERWESAEADRARSGGAGSGDCRCRHAAGGGAGGVGSERTLATDGNRHQLGLQLRWPARNRYHLQSHDRRELPVGQSGDRPRPGSRTLSPVLAVSGGSAYSLALLSNGRVRAWGDGDHGELGDGVNGLEQDRPVAVVGPGGTGQLTNITSISAGNVHSLAIGRSGIGPGGQVWSWGANLWGELGDGTRTGPEHRPVGNNPPSSSDVCSTVPVGVVGPGGTGHLTNVVARARARRPKPLACLAWSPAQGPHRSAAPRLGSTRRTAIS